MEEDCIRNDDFIMYSEFLQLQFENEQLRFENKQLNKIISNKNETIKLLEETLLEKRNWDDILYENDELIPIVKLPSNIIENKVVNNELIPVIKSIPENTIIPFQNNIVNHINSVLIKKGLYKNTRLAHQYICNKNINIK
jgi:hypothetical protein